MRHSSPRLRELLQLRQRLDWEIDEERTRLGFTMAERTQERIIENAATLFVVSVDDIMGKSRAPRFADPRHIVMWMLRREGLSYPQIGRLFNRDHTTIMYGCRRVERMPALMAVAEKLSKKVAA